jgi:Flp pilus assembly protein TadG
MATLNRSSRRGEGGQAIVELALTLPLLLLVVLGVFDFGLMFQRYEVVTNAAREAARVAVLPDYSTTQAEIHGQNYMLAGGVTGGSVVVTQVAEVLPTTPPKTIVVMVATVTYTHQHVFVGPIMSLFGGSLGNVPLTAVSRMRKE